MPYSLTKSNQEFLLDTAARLTNSTGWFSDAVAFAAKTDASPNPVAIGVFQNFANSGAEIHFSTIGTHLQKNLINTYLTLAFHPKFLGLKRLFAHIPVSNIRSQRAAIGLGFQFQYRKPSSATGGEDAIVLMLEPISGS